MHEMFFKTHVKLVVSYKGENQVKKKKQYTYRTYPDTHAKFVKILRDKGFKYGKGASMTKMVEAIVNDELLLISKKDLTNW